MGVSTGARFPPVLPRSPDLAAARSGLLALFALALDPPWWGRCGRGSLSPPGSGVDLEAVGARRELARAFYLLRDFTLDPPPAAGRLLVSADEEYILYLNGRRIGSGRYAVGPSGGGPARPLRGGAASRAGGQPAVAEVRAAAAPAASSSPWWTAPAIPSWGPTTAGGFPPRPAVPPARPRPTLAGSPSGDGRSGRLLGPAAHGPLGSPGARSGAAPL